MSKNGLVKCLLRVPEPAFRGRDVRNSGATTTFRVVACNVCFQEAATLIPAAEMRRKAVV